MSCSSCLGSKRDPEDSAYPCPQCSTVGSRRLEYLKPKKVQVDIFDLVGYTEPVKTKEIPVSQMADIMSLDTPAAAPSGSKFPPTPEQAKIIEAFQTGGSLSIEAGAGAGKTTTLKMLANSMPQRKGLYLCYNKATADEAKGDFPDSVKCSTAHSLAYGVAGHKFRNRLNDKRVPPWEIAKWLGVHRDFYVNTDVSLTPMAVAGRVMDTIRRFCYSSDSGCACVIP